MWNPWSIIARITRTICYVIKQVLKKEQVEMILDLKKIIEGISDKIQAAVVFLAAFQKNVDLQEVREKAESIVKEEMRTVKKRIEERLKTEVLGEILQKGGE